MVTGYLLGYVTGNLQTILLFIDEPFYYIQD